MAHKFYPPRETRSASRFLHNQRGDVTPNLDWPNTPRQTPKKASGHKLDVKMTQPLKCKDVQPRSDDSSKSISDEDAVAAGASEGSIDSDEDESEAFAPSGHASQRMGYQAGLSKTKSQDDPINRSNSQGSANSEPEPPEFWFDTTRPARVREAPQDEDSSDDDDGYQGVDSITDSEEDEPEVEKLEENLIIESMEKDDVSNYRFLDAAGPLPHETWPGHDENDAIVSNNEFSLLFPTAPRTDRLTFEDLFDESFSDATIFPAFRSSPAAPQRRVHFADEIDEIYEPDDFYEFGDSIEFGLDTDTFVLRDSLSHRLARIIEDDNDEDGNCFRVPQQGGHHAHRSRSMMPEHAAALTPAESPIQSGYTSDASGGNLSGYETDEGEETDDEMLPPTTVNRPHTLLRLHSTSSMSRPVAPTLASSSGRQSVAKGQTQHRGPRIGSFKVDLYKPMAFIDHTGEYMVFRPGPEVWKANEPLATDSSSTDSSVPCSPRGPSADLVKMYAVDQNREKGPFEEAAQDHMISTGTNLMIPGPLQPATGMQLVNSGDILGPPEAFFPFSDVGPDGSVMTDVDMEEPDNDAGESVLNVEDFIDFGDSSSDDDAGAVKLLSPSSSQENKAAALPLDNATNNSRQALLGHFDNPALVTAFRRNQDRYAAGTRHFNVNPAPRALKGPRLGAFSISPKSPIKSPIQQRKENIQAFHHRSPSYLGVPAMKKVQSTHRRIRST